MRCSNGLWCCALGAAAFVAPRAAPAQHACDVGVWVESPVFARSHYSMVYDRRRDRVVLFGGNNGHADLGDTWEFDGTAWKQVADSGPEPRYGAPMAYDQFRGRTVMWGGSGGDSSRTNATWEWDGVEWTRHEAGPPIGSSSAAFDPALGLVLTFGYNWDSVGEIWGWDGKTWSKVDTGGPSHRSGYSLAYDPARNRLVLFGSHYYSTDTDVWEWDGASWTQFTEPGPWAFENQPLCYDAAEKGVLLLGQDRWGTWQELWRWNGSDWTKLDADAPFARKRNAGMAYDSARSRAVVFGGVDGWLTLANDTWAWAGGGWNRLAETDPGKRRGCAMVYDPDRAEIVLFGGAYDPVQDHNGDARPNDTWVRRGEVWSRAAADGPPGRDRPAMAYDLARKRVVMFGGRGDVPLGDTWEWDGKAWSLAATSGPSPRETSIAYDVSRNRTVLFGGLLYDSSGYTRYGDTWEWDGHVWTERKVAGPSPRYGHVLADDYIRGDMILWGGNAMDGDLSTWTWDGSSWRKLGGPTPSRPVWYGAAAYDPDLVRIVVQGGHYIVCPDKCYDIVSDGTWAWYGTGWYRLTQASTLGVPEHEGHALAYDESLGASVVYGDSPVAGAWELRLNYPPVIGAQPRDAAAGYRRFASFEVVAEGTTPMTFQWRKDGKDLHDDGRIWGTTWATLRIPDVRQSDAGEYSCVVSNPCASTTSEPATLTPLCLADCNKDGRLNINDFICFQASLRKVGCDYDGDMGCDINDFIAFQADFVRGCPW